MYMYGIYLYKHYRSACTILVSHTCSRVRCPEKRAVPEGPRYVYTYININMSIYIYTYIYRTDPNCKTIKIERTIFKLHTCSRAQSPETGAVPKGLRPRCRRACRPQYLSLSLSIYIYIYLSIFILHTLK